MNNLFKVEDFRKYSDTYVESGTCLGDGLSRAVAAGFTCKSVELHPPYFEQSTKRFAGNPKVTLFEGDSRRHLTKMLEDKPCVIFLDAHPSGPGSGGHDDLMEKGKESTFQQDIILEDELGIILTHRPDHVILIDDQHGASDFTDRLIDMARGVNKDYQAIFLDECLADGIYRKDKILVLIPK